MKRTYLFIFTLLFLLTPAAWAMEDLSYLQSKGMSHFNIEEYAQALKFFEKIYALDPKNEPNLYRLGLTHIRLKQFGKASKYLKKLLAQNPDYTEAYFDYGLCLFEQNQLDKALPWFEKASAKEWIERIQKKKSPPEGAVKMKRWDLNASSAFYYDSNVTRDPIDENLSGFSDQKDYLTAGTLNFRYLLANKEKKRLYLELDGYQSAHFNFHFDSNRFNFGRHKAGLELVYKINDYIQWSLPGYYTFSYLGKAKYLQSGEMESTLDMLHMEHWMFSVTGGIRRDWFAQSLNAAAQNRDATQPYARLEQYFFAPHNREVHFKAGYGFEKNYASGTDWDFYAHHILYAIHFPVWWKVKFLMVGDVVVQRNFKNIDSVFNGLRKDESTYNGVVLAKDILPLLRVAASYSFFFRDSSLNRYTHKRHVAGLTFSTKL